MLIIERNSIDLIATICIESVTTAFPIRGSIAVLACVSKVGKEE